MIRAAIYQDLAAPVRAERHERAARLLHENGASIEQVAAQLVLSDPINEPWASGALIEAADRAIGLGSSATAVSCLGNARETRVDSGLLARLGWAQALVGRPAAV